MVFSQESILWYSEVCKKAHKPMNTNFYLRNYLNKEGKAQIYLCITSHPKRKRIPLDLFTIPEDWDKKAQRLKKKAENSEVINLILDKISAKIANIKISYKLSGRQLTVESLYEEYKLDCPNTDFISFMRYHLEKLNITPNSYKKNLSEINKITEFRKEIPFSDLSLEFLDAYKSFLFKVKNNAPTTIAGSMKVILKFLKMAKKYGVFLNFNLDDVKVGKTTGNRVNLTLEEVKRLDSYYNSEFIKPHHFLALGYFLFSCYTSLRISDVQKLKRENLMGNSFSYISTKTRKPHTLILNNRAKAVLEKNEELFIKRVSDQKINKALKEIANICSIKKKLHFHIARHSFATNFLRLGGKIEDLQIIMDHSDLSTTMIYVHIVKAESVESMYLMDKL